MKKAVSCYTLSGILFVIGATGFVSAQSPTIARLGSIPAEAIRNGKLNVSMVPEHVVAYARDGQIAGYVKKEDLFDEKGNHKIQRIRVLDGTALNRTVGFMVPDRGFVPIGVDEKTVPTFDGTLIEEDEE